MCIIAVHFQVLLTLHRCFFIKIGIQTISRVKKGILGEIVHIYYLPELDVALSDRRTYLSFFLFFVFFGLAFIPIQ